MMKTVYYILSGVKCNLLLYLMECQGSVRLLFQPGEEGSGGAKRMVEEGALDDASAIFAIHVNVNLPPGMVSGRSGPFMAASGFFKVHIQGQGAHAGTPHLSIDPIQAATAVVQSLQQLVSREADPLDSQVSKCYCCYTRVGLVSSFFDAIRVSTMRFPHCLYTSMVWYLTIFLFSLPFRSIYYARIFVLGKFSVVSIWFGIILTQIITWVYNDPLTLTHPPNTNS